MEIPNVFRTMKFADISILLIILATVQTEAFMTLLEEELRRIYGRRGGRKEVLDPELMEASEAVEQQEMTDPAGGLTVTPYDILFLRRDILYAIERLRRTIELNYGRSPYLYQSYKFRRYPYSSTLL